MQFYRKTVQQRLKKRTDRKTAAIRLAAWQANKGGPGRRSVTETLENRTLLTTAIPIVNPGFETLYEPGSTAVTATLPGGAGTFDANPFGPSAIVKYQVSGDIYNPDPAEVAAQTGYEVATVPYSDGTSGNFVDVPGWSAPSFPATYAQVVNVAPQINVSGQSSISVFPGKTDNILQLNGPGAARQLVASDPTDDSLGPAYQTVTQQLTTSVQPNSLYTLSVQVGLDIDDDPTNLATPIIANVEVNGTPLTLVSSNISQVQAAIEAKARPANAVKINNVAQTGLSFLSLPVAVQGEFNTLAQGADLTNVKFGEYKAIGQEFFAPDPTAPNKGILQIKGPDGASQPVVLSVDPSGNPIGPGTFQTLTETFYANSSFTGGQLLTLTLGTGPNSTTKNLQTSFDNVSLTQAPAAPSPVVGASISTSNITSAAPSAAISVTYTSSNGFKPATAGVNAQNIEIVGPFGNLLTNDTAGAPVLNPDGSMTVTYTLPAPDGGAFSNFDNGNYQVLVVPGSVVDKSGMAVGFESASFSVNVPLATTTAIGPTLDFTSEDAAAQQDGGTIVAGHTGSALDLTSASVATLQRLTLNSDGSQSLDSTFDTNSFNAVMGVLSARSAFFGDAVVDPSVDPQNGGKIVAVGTDNGDIVVARFNTDGTLDGTFASGGVFHAGFPAGGDSRAFSVAIAPDKNIVVGGTDSIGDYLFIRLTPSGAPDVSFNPNGINNSQIQLSTGLVSRALQGVFAAKHGGELLLSSGGEGGNAIDQIVVQPSSDGNPADYTVLGVGDASQLTGTGASSTETKIVAVFEVSSTGAPNPQFSSVPGGTASVATFAGPSQPIPGLSLLPELVPESLGADVPESPIGIALQSNGDIIVVAGTDPSDSTHSEFGVARLTPNGQPDASFGSDGIVTTAFPGGDAFANSVSITGGDGIIVSGTSYGTAGLESAFAQYTKDGQPNTSFDMPLITIDATDAGADAPDLNSSTIDANLAADFTAANFTLGSGATVSVAQAGQQWSITDGSVVYNLQQAGDGSIDVTSPGIFVSPSGLTVSNAVHGVHGKNIVVVPPPVVVGNPVEGPITGILSAPGQAGTSTTIRIQFVDPFPQLVASQVTATTDSSTVPFTVVFTAPKNSQINAATLISTASTLQVTDTSAAGRAITATIMPGQNLTNAQELAVVYELTAPSNWMASDAGTYHVALPPSANVLDTESTPVAIQTGEFGTFQLNVHSPLASVGTGVQLGAIQGNIPATAVGQTTFTAPLHLVVTNDSANSFREKVVLTVYASQRNDSYTGNQILLRSFTTTLNLGVGKSRKVIIRRLEWPGLPGDYYLLASLTDQSGTTLNENIGASSVVQVTQPIFDLSTISVTSQRSTLVSGNNIVFAVVQNVGNIVAREQGAITISVANQANSTNGVTSPPVISVPIRTHLRVGQSFRVAIRFRGITLLTGGPVKLKIDISMDQDLNTANDSAVTGVLTS